MSAWQSAHWVAIVVIRERQSDAPVAEASRPAVERMRITPGTQAVSSPPAQALLAPARSGFHGLETREQDEARQRLPTNVFRCARHEKDLAAALPVRDPAHSSPWLQP